MIAWKRGRAHTRRASTKVRGREAEDGSNVQQERWYCEKVRVRWDTRLCGLCAGQSVAGHGLCALNKRDESLRCILTVMYSCGKIRSVMYDKLCRSRWCTSHLPGTRPVALHVAHRPHPLTDPILSPTSELARPKAALRIYLVHIRTSSYRPRGWPAKFPPLPHVVSQSSSFSPDQILPMSIQIDRWCLSTYT